MKVLSLFDGLSAGQIALDKLGIEVSKYYACEIDKYAVKVSQTNYPDMIHLGDVTKVGKDLIPDKIDLLIGGSPCQGFSFAGKQLNFQDSRSKLFFEYVRIMKEIKPKYFLLENVRMKKESMDIITSYMGVEPIEINSALVSGQSRKRLYWTNIPFDTNIKDRGIVLRDILQEDVPDKYLAGERLLKNYRGGNQLNPDYKSQANTIHPIDGKAGTVCAGTHGYANGYVQGCIQVGEAGGINGHDILKRVYSAEGKAPTLNTMGGGNREPKVVYLASPIREKSKTVRSGGRSSYDRHEWDSVDQLHWRKLTPMECERLQTIPDNYTNHVSDTQRYKMLGNSFTVDVIAEILRGME